MKMIKLIPRNGKKVLKIVIGTVLAIILFLAITLISATLFSEKIGDSYMKHQEVSDSIYWYELNYDVFKSKESLKKLILSLQLTDDFANEVVYLPKLINDPTSNLEFSDKIYYQVTYIEALYYIGDIENFKKVFAETIDSYEMHPLFAGPIELIVVDENASVSDLQWMLTMSNRIIEKSKNIYTQAPIYFYQSHIYSRLGDVTKSLEIMKKYEELDAQMLNKK